MARKKKVEETTIMQETAIEQIAQQVAEQPKNKRIIMNKDTELRKFPTLQQAHVTGIAKKGSMHEVVQTIGGLYGWFYKLNNGCYVVKEGNYIEV